MFSWIFLGALLAAQSSAADASNWDSLEVAVVQYPLIGYLSAQEMFVKVKGYVDVASGSGANLIVLPELFACDMLNFKLPASPQFFGIAEEIFPDFIEALGKLAASAGVYILAGSVPFENPETKKIRNRSYLLSPDKPPVYQDKIFLTPDEVEWGWEASDTLNVIQAPWGTTIISICYDSEFPLISQTVAGHAVDVILIPSMTGEPGFTRVRWAAQARAVEHMSYVLLTGVTGAPNPGWEMTAQGVVLGPSLPGFNATISEGEKDQGGCIVRASLNMTQLRDAKRTGDYYPALNQQSVAIEQIMSVL